MSTRATRWPQRSRADDDDAHGDPGVARHTCDWRLTRYLNMRRDYRSGSTGQRIIAHRHIPSWRNTVDRNSDEPRAKRVDTRSRRAVLVRCTNACAHIAQWEAVMLALSRCQAARVGAAVLVALGFIALSSTSAFAQ